MLHGYFCHACEAQGDAGDVEQSIALVSQPCTGQGVNRSVECVIGRPTAIAVGIGRRPKLLHDEFNKCVSRDDVSHLPALLPAQHGWYVANDTSACRCCQHVDVSIGLVYDCGMNITKLLVEIQAAGWSQRDIAERVGTTQATIWRHARGRSAEIGLSLGMAIMALHREVCGASGQEAA